MEIPHENVSIDDVYQNYIKYITSIIEKHAPITRRKLTNRKHKTWYDKDALKLKIQRRKAEKLGIKSSLNQTKSITYMLTNAIRHWHHPKKKTLRDQLSTDKNRSRTAYKINKTLKNTKENIIPSLSSNKELAYSFANFFVEKNQQNQI